METKTDKSAPDTVTVVVNGKETPLPKGQNLLKALLDSGTNVPHYCWHPSLSVAGNCRLCMVEIEGQPRPAVSCNMTCTDGLKIKTDSEMVLDARKGMMEFLLQNHPLDCPICDRGGECMLQRYSMQHGTGTARTVDTRRRFEKPQFDPLIDIERNRCIMCTRCVRFMDEEGGDHVLGVFGRGDRNYIGTEGNGPVSNIFSGNIIDLCPVGCLTSKPFRFKARAWELQQVNSTCTLCSAGCETTAWIRDGQVYRVTPPVRKYGQQFTIDEDTTRFICNEGRFGNMYANSPDRLRKAYVRKGEALEPVKLGEALKPAAEALEAAAKAGPEKVAILTGTRVTNEEFYLLSRLARVALGTHQIDWRLDYLTAAAAKAASVALGASDGDLKLLEQKAYAATLFIGSDLQETVPVTGLHLRDAARHRQTELHMVGSRLDNWLSPHAKTAVSIQPDAIGSFLAEVAGHVAGTKKSRKKDVAPLAEGLRAAATGVIVLSLDEAGGIFAADRVRGALELLRQLGEGWKFVPVFHGRNAKGAYAAGAQGDRLPSGTLDDEAARNLAGELWGEVKAKGEAGPTAIEILEAAAEGKIQTLLLHRPDELVHHPNRALIEKALDATPNVILVDVFPSWISEKATVVLPGAFFYEVEGSMLSADGTVHALMQANLPPGEAQEDWRIIDTLCDMLGAPSRYDRATDIFADLVRCWGAPPRTRLSDFWLEGPGFESPQRPQPAVIRKKTRPDFRVQFSARDGEPAEPASETKSEAADFRLLFVTAAQGTDHLGSRCTEFAELRPDARIEMNSKDAKKLKLEAGALVRTLPGREALRVEINESIPKGIVYAASNVLGLEWAGGEQLPAVEIETAEVEG